MNRYHRPMARQEEKGISKASVQKGNALPNLKAATGAFNPTPTNPNRLPAGRQTSDKVKGMVDGYTLKRADRTAGQKFADQIMRKAKRVK